MMDVDAHTAGRGRAHATLAQPAGRSRTHAALAHMAGRGRARLALTLALTWLLAALPPSVAASAEALGGPAGEPMYYSLAAGFFDVADGDADDDAADLRLEYRHGAGIWHLRPWAGLELTSEGALWIGSGVLLDLPLGRRFALTCSTSAGAYERGRGKELGSIVMFRTQAELSYRLRDRSRLAVGFSHLSNAGIGERNPGAEVLSLYYHLPLTVLGGR